MSIDATMLNAVDVARILRYRRRFRTMCSFQPAVMSTRLLWRCAWVVAVLANSASAFAQSAENVAVVINDASPQSQRIGDHYIKTRGIPAANVIHVRLAATETITRAAYTSAIEGPIAQALRRNALQDRILYVVLTKGIPLRISGTSGLDGTVSSVDSELTLLYRRMTGRQVAVAGRVANPYFLDAAPIRSAQPFTHQAHDIFLVTRLDGFTVEEVVALIDRGRTSSQEGRFVLDQRGGIHSDRSGDAWLAEASRRLGEVGLRDRVVLESTTDPVRNITDVLGYYSWGSNDPQNRVRRVQMRFVPGALAATFVSSDARTFENPPADWVPLSDWDNRATWYGGSPQSLTGDLIREGATGVAGHVAEPYLQSTIRPEILFPAYVSGFNLVEAFYLAMPHLSWQTIVVGDPLCAPFPRKVLTRADIERGIDQDTEFPALFAAKRQEAVRAAFRATPPAALTLLLRAESRSDRGDENGAREALEQATELAPALTGAQIALALAFQRTGNFAAAVDRYRRALKAEPGSVVALNNLAYVVGVNQQKPTEALEVARRAAALAPNNVEVLDTLAWIEHLNGNSREAAKIMRQVVAIGAGIAELHVHAAIVFAAVGDLVAANTHLAKALKLDPAIDKRDDVQALQKQLKRD
jgi:uncharacterized protein (TIGR03790 family)